jgi:hypothetical protein
MNPYLSYHRCNVKLEVGPFRSAADETTKPLRGRTGAERTGQGTGRGSQRTARSYGVGVLPYSYSLT